MKVRTILRRFQREGVIPQDADVAELATGFVAAVRGGYLLAQTSRDVTPMASAIDMGITHLHLLAREQDDRGQSDGEEFRIGQGRKNTADEQDSAAVG